MKCPIRILLLLAGLLLPGAALLAADSSIAVIAVSDITDQGQGTRRPTPANPVYYYPRTNGFINSGATVDGVTSPPKPNVEVMLVKALASQGYIYHKLANKPPSIMLVFAWGYMAPKFRDTGTIENKDEMVSLVEGLNPIDESDGSLQGSNMGSALKTARFYLTISAVDYNALAQQKYITLWCTRVSTAIDNNQLAQVLPALLRAATPLLGTQTNRHDITVVPL
jgi:hypothetical protein